MADGRNEFRLRALRLVNFLTCCCPEPADRPASTLGQLSCRVEEHKFEQEVQGAHRAGDGNDDRALSSIDPGYQRRDIRVDLEYAEYLARTIAQRHVRFDHVAQLDFPVIGIECVAPDDHAVFLATRRHLDAGVQHDPGADAITTRGIQRQAIQREDIHAKHGQVFDLPADALGQLADFRAALQLRPAARCRYVVEQDDVIDERIRQ